MKEPCVYILASQPCGALYIGVTSNLPGRLAQHRAGAIPGSTERYGVHRLVRVEACDAMERAILREKQLKNWRRQGKINLVERENPAWVYLAVGLGLPSLDGSVGRHGC